MFGIPDSARGAGEGAVNDATGLHQPEENH